MIKLQKSLFSLSLYRMTTTIEKGCSEIIKRDILIFNFVSLMY